MCALIRKLLGRSDVAVLWFRTRFARPLLHLLELYSIRMKAIIRNHLAASSSCKMVGTLAFRPHSSRNRIRRRLPFSFPSVSPFKWKGTCALRLSSSFRLALLCTVELSSTEPAQIYKIDRWWCASKSLSNILSIYPSIYPSYLPTFKDSGGEQFSFTGAAAYIFIWLGQLGFRFCSFCFSLPPLAVAMMKGFNLGNSHNSGFLMTKASFDENALVYIYIYIYIVLFLAQSRPAAIANPPSGNKPAGYTPFFHPFTTLTKSVYSCCRQATNS